MIVVDTNIIAYLYLNNDQSAAVEELLAADPHWIAPLLWRSEMRNILALYLRQQILTLDLAKNIQAKAEALLHQREFTVDSESILTLAQVSGCSAYDCEFMALAQIKNAPLITADKKLLAAFGDRAFTVAGYLERTR